MDKRELALFLRSRRERIAPEEVGLVPGGRRRTPGLRREEVATLAHISAEYYVRLEQARAPRPSLEVLASLAGTLGLDDVERQHLHHLAGTPPAPPRSVRRDVPAAVLEMIERMPSTAAFVVSADFDVLAFNRLAGLLLHGLADASARDRNLARRAFLGGGDGLYRVSDRAEFQRIVVLRLRAAAARYPDDGTVRRLIDELRGGSALFADLWGAHDVDVAPALTKTFAHPLVGRVTVDCTALDVADRDQEVVLYTAEPGSSSARALERLAKLGSAPVEVAG